VFIQTHAPQLYPMGFQQSVEELAGPQLDFPELPTLIVLQLRLGMPRQDFANDQAGVIVMDLSAFVCRIDQAICAIDVNGGRGTIERAKEPGPQQGSQFETERWLIRGLQSTEQT
jgi:hypothetical protein